MKPIFALILSMVLVAGCAPASPLDSFEKVDRVYVAHLDYLEISDLRLILASSDLYRGEVMGLQFLPVPDERGQDLVRALQDDFQLCAWGTGLFLANKRLYEEYESELLLAFEASSGLQLAIMGKKRSYQKDVYTAFLDVEVDENWSYEQRSCYTTDTLHSEYQQLIQYVENASDGYAFDGMRLLELSN